MSGIETERVKGLNPQCNVNIIFHHKLFCYFQSKFINWLISYVIKSNISSIVNPQKIINCQQLYWIVAVDDFSSIYNAKRFPYCRTSLLPLLDHSFSVTFTINSPVAFFFGPHILILLNLFLGLFQSYQHR